MKWHCLYLVSDQLDTKFVYMSCLFRFCTCFEQSFAHPQEDNCINTTSGIINLSWCLAGMQVEKELHIYRYDDTRGCVIQFWPPNDEHMCSKYVEAWNKTYCETNFSASSWLNAEINNFVCCGNTIYCIFNTCCIISVQFSTKCRLFSAVFCPFVPIVLMFFISHAL